MSLLAMLKQYSTDEKCLRDSDQATLAGRRTLPSAAKRARFAIWPTGNNLICASCSYQFSVTTADGFQ